MALTDQVVFKPTPTDGAMRVRRMVTQSLAAMESNLRQIGQVIQIHGRANIDQALGADAAQLPVIYSKLKSCLIDLDPSRQIPDLP